MIPPGNVPKINSFWQTGSSKVEVRQLIVLLIEVQTIITIGGGGGGGLGLVEGGDKEKNHRSHLQEPNLG